MTLIEFKTAVRDMMSQGTKLFVEVHCRESFYADGNKSSYELSATTQTDLTVTLRGKNLWEMYTTLVTTLLHD